MAKREKADDVPVVRKKTAGKKAATAKPESSAGRPGKIAAAAVPVRTARTRDDILLVAAECRDLAKIGGLGDVVRDLAATFAAIGVRPRVILPYYEVLDCVAEPVMDFGLDFAGEFFTVHLFRTLLPDGVPVYLVHSDRWFSGSYGTVYVNSGLLGHGPFEDDATRFAFFSAAVARLLLVCPEFAAIGTLHCHDWHMGPLFVILAHDPEYAALFETLATFFTIHNLDYQGARPWRRDGSPRPGSFAAWFPALFARLESGTVMGRYSDPVDGGCFNPMRAAIRLAGTVTTVSPTYAREITEPDDPARNFIGGRGLEPDLAALAAAGRLPGILNGIDYSQYDPKKFDPPWDAGLPDWRRARTVGRERFVDGMPDWVRGLAGKHGSRFRNSGSALAAMDRFEPLLWKNRALFVAVTRTVAQKFGILMSAMDDGRTLLEHVLDRPLVLLVLGSGDFENRLNALMQRPNALFLNLFDASAAGLLYGYGDVFLMPSDFEPCGISQLVSMRYGCLPLVHDIGGLHDTVEHGETGFAYGGGSLESQQKKLLALVDDAIWLRENRAPRWVEMQEAAMRVRFDWPGQAKKYLGMYRRA